MSAPDLRVRWPGLRKHGSPASTHALRHLDQRGWWQDRRLRDPLWVALIVAAVLAVLAVADIGGLALLLENLQWTVSSLIAVAIAIRSLRTASAAERPVRVGIAAATVCWLSGQIAWDVQVASGWAVVPAPSDLLCFATLVPSIWALDRVVRSTVEGGTRLAVRLDDVVVLLATATVLTLAFNQSVMSSTLLTTVLLLGLPIGFFAVAGAALVAALASGADPRRGGLYGIVLGTALLGAAYLPWVADAPAVPAAGSLTNVLFSLGILGLAAGGATYRAVPDARVEGRSPQSLALDSLPLVAAASALACLIITSVNGEQAAMLVRPLGWSVVAVAVVRQLLLSRERGAAVERANAVSAELALIEERHRGLIEQIPATVYIDERVTAGETTSRLVFISPQVTRLLGYRPKALLRTPKHWYRLIHSDDAATVAMAEDRHFSTGAPLDQTFRMRTRDGRYVWVRDEANLVPLPDGRLQSHGVLTDVTAQREAEDQVRASEEQQRRIIDTASAAYISIDAEGAVLEWNERAVSTFGWPRSEALGRRLSDLIVPVDQRAAHEAGLRRFAAEGGGPLVGGRVEVQAVDRNGRVFPVELSVWPLQVGSALRFSALVHDITERRRLEEELRHQAFHDSLTGLANRALFADRLAHALERRGGRATVLYFDVDDFKLVNDQQGHAAGDMLLVAIAQRLSTMLRPGDTAARLGGDEFAVLFEDGDAASASGIAQRLLDLFAEPFTSSGRSLSAQVSVGVAVGADGVSAERLLREADVAMYEAKRRGKGVWQLFDPSLSLMGLDAVELRADLKRAIGTSQITVAYQPILDLASRRPVAVEALARWRHPVRGEVPPSEFIPVAEGSDLIATLGLQVLTEACATIQRIRTDGSMPDLRLSVNLSARQLLLPSIVEDVEAVLTDTGLEPAALTLEITEGVVVDDAGRSIAAIEGLKALGLRMAIDDFGTGYSSLSYLSRLPIDALKIDRSFVADMLPSRQSRVLVRSIIRIGQTLNLETVAEGVETEEQAAQLQRLGAGLGQGYLFGRPMDRHALIRHLRRQGRRADGSQTPFPLATAGDRVPSVAAGS